MKKLINAPDSVVQDALHGIEAAHGDRVRVSYDPAVIVRIDAPALAYLLYASTLVAMSS